MTYRYKITVPAGMCRRLAIVANAAVERGACWAIGTARALENELSMTRETTRKVSGPMAMLLGRSLYARLVHYGRCSAFASAALSLFEMHFVTVI